MTQPILHEANGKRWLLVEVPKGAYDFEVIESGLYFDFPEGSSTYISLPPGSWQIIIPGTADKLTEEQVAELVGPTPYIDYTIHNLLSDNYKGLWVATVLESFASLLRYHGLSAATTVVLGEVK